MNDEYRAFFGADFPARATVVTPLVAGDGLVEIMVTAVGPGSDPRDRGRCRPSLTLPGADDRRPAAIGISACLLGDEVRFDGGHKRDAFLADVLGAVRRVGPGLSRSGDRAWARRARRCGWCAPATAGAPRHHPDRRSITPMRWRLAAPRRASSPARTSSGYILKKDSPSCGMERVKVYGASGVPQRNGAGLFAAALLPRFPNLPVEEEGRLTEPAAARELHRAGVRVPAAAAVVRRAPGPSAASSASTPRTRCRCSRTRRPATASSAGWSPRAAAMPPRARFAATTSPRFMATMARRDARRHTNVLMHMAGHLKKLLDAGVEAELRRASTSTAAGWSRWSCRSRCCATTCDGTRSPTCSARPISSRIRAS